MQRFIYIFHQDAVKRLRFLPELHTSGHREEATTLCLCYMDSFAQLICWPKTTVGKNFVAAISDFGGDLTFRLVHPLHATRVFSSKKSFWKDLATHIVSLFPGPNYELLTETELLAKLEPYLYSKTINPKDILNELWQTTLASVVYHYFRNPAVHGFGAGPGWSFSATTYQGAPVTGIGFDRLYNVALNLHAELRRRSEATGQLCGDDGILDA